jgi:hypothetical protein
MGKKLKLNLRFLILSIAIVFVIAGALLILKKSSSSNSAKKTPASVVSETEIKTIKYQGTSEELNNKDNLYTDSSNLPDMPLPQSTVSDLTTKGMPLMPHGRQIAYEQTKTQTITEVVADLGNHFMIGYTHNVNVLGAYFDISTWANDIQSNLKVLRLIEEGQQNKSEISNLLEKALSDCLDDFEENYKLYKEKDAAFAKGETPSSLSMSDEYYEQNKRYQDPIFEIDRILHVLYSSFYVLANLGELENPKLLSKWIDLSYKYLYGCPEMNVWLIDQYFKNDNSTYAEIHKNLRADQYISGKSITVSKWDALWDIYDPMIAAMSVNTSDIQTMEILEIPYTLSISMPKATGIFENFQSYCKEKKNE